MLDFTQFNRSLQRKQIRQDETFTLGAINSLRGLNKMNFLCPDEIKKTSAKPQAKAIVKKEAQTKINLAAINYDSQRQRFAQTSFSYKQPEQYSKLIAQMRSFDSIITREGLLQLSVKDDRGLIIQLLQLLGLQEDLYTVTRIEGNIFAQFPTVQHCMEEDTCLTNLYDQPEEHRLQRVKRILEAQTQADYELFLQQRKINHCEQLYFKLKLHHPDFNLNSCPTIQACYPEWASQNEMGVSDLKILVNEILKIFQERCVNFMLVSVLMKQLVMRIPRVTVMEVEQSLKDLMILMPQVLKMDWTRVELLQGHVLQLNKSLSLQRILCDLDGLLV